MSTATESVIDFLSEQTKRTGQNGARSNRITTSEIRRAAKEGAAEAIREYNDSLSSDSVVEPESAQTDGTSESAESSGSSSGGSSLKLVLLLGLAAAYFLRKRQGSR